VKIPFVQSSYRAAGLSLELEARPKVEVEIWQSSQNRHERHYFLRNGQHAYQDGQYICGVNPELVTPEQERAILAILGYAVDSA
jgi:hypothetical protein